MLQIHPEQIAKALINETFHSRRLVVAVFVAVNVTMLAVGLQWPKVFTTSTSILVEDRNIVQPLMQGAAVATEVTDRGRNAREVIHGRRIMDQILEDGGWLKDAMTLEDRQRIIEQIKSRTVVTQVGRNIIRIEYRDENSERVFHTTQKFADLFMQESMSAQAAESSAAFSFIEKQTQEYQEKLARTEEKLKQLRSGALGARAGNETEVMTRMNEVQTRIERANQELREAEIKGASLERQVSGEAEATTAITRDTQYEARMGELQTKLDALRLSYHDTHPDIVQIKLQIQSLTDRANAQRERRDQAKKSGRAEADQSAVNNPVYQQLRRDLSQNQVTVESLRGRIADAQGQMQQEMSRGRLMHTEDARLAELTRDYQVNRDIYQDLLRRRENARVSMNLDRGRQGLTFKILEPATVPLSPKGLRFAHFVAGGILLGILVPLGLIFARLQLDPRIRIGAVISMTHKVPLAAVIPHLWTPGEIKTLRRELLILTLTVGATLVMSVAVSVLRLTKVM